MPKTKLALSLAVAFVAASLAIAPAGAKSSSSSHSSSSHSSSSHSSSSGHTRSTATKTGKPRRPRHTVEHACKTQACRSNHPGGTYQTREKFGADG